MGGFQQNHQVNQCPLWDSSRLVLKPFDLRGLRSDDKGSGVNKVMWLPPCPVPNIKGPHFRASPLWESLHCHWNHCTAHREHTVTISSLHKWIEEQSSSISSKAQSQSCRPKSSHLKGKISIYSCVTLLHLRWNWCNDSVVVDVFLFSEVEQVNSGPQLLRD